MIQEIIAVIAIPVARSFGGWATWALKDGKVSDFELRKLGETVLKTSIIGGMIYFGANGFGLDVDLIASSASAVILEKITKSLKEHKVVKNKS